jgi:hypothetical protein
VLTAKIQAGEAMLTAGTPINMVGLVAEMFDALDEPMSPAAARFLLKLKLPRAHSKRMKTLNEKANEGTLTPQEREDLQRYIDTCLWLAVLQSRARASGRKRKQMA